MESTVNKYLNLLCSNVVVHDVTTMESRATWYIILS